MTSYAREYRPVNIYGKMNPYLPVLRGKAANLMHKNTGI